MTDDEFDNLLEYVKENIQNQHFGKKLVRMFIK